MARGTLRVILPAPRPSIAELLYDQQAEFDALLRDLSGGIRSPDHFDTLEARASAIGQAMRDAFRRGRAGRG